MNNNLSDLIFMSLTTIAGLDLLAAVVTDAPSALIGIILLVCLGLIVINERMRPNGLSTTA